MAFSIIKESKRRNNRFKLNQHTVEFKLNPLEGKVENPEEWLKEGLRAIYNHVVKSLTPDDKMGMTFTAEDFESDFHISFKEVSKHSFEDLWKMMNLLYQSRKESVEGDTFKIITTSFTPLRGRGRNTEESLTYEEDCRKRRGIVCIKNKDNLCLARALVVAIAYIMNVPYLEQVRRNIGKRQDQEAQKLMAAAGVTIPEEGATIKELQQFQQHLSDFKIVVYKYNSKGRDIMYQGPDATKILNLLHHENHFNVITSLTSAFCCSYYCQRCHVGYAQKDHHRCKGQCPGCRKEPPCQVVSKELLCQDCNRQFRGPTCYENHKVGGKAGKSQCDIVRKCGVCFKFVKKDREHFCDGEIFCRTCKKHQPTGHLCFIQQDIRVPRLDDTLFIFYDLETRQDEQNLRGENVHVPVLCVFQQRCSQCFDIESNDLLTCSKCGVRRQIIKCGDIAATFFEHLWLIGKKFKNTVVLAHNGSSYDHQFIFRHVLEQTDLNPGIIKRGSRLLMLNIGRKIKLIDSFNYFPMKLAALPKAFGLQELKKGYFPHLFNTLANKDYTGRLPDSKYYSPNTMKSADRSEFLNWYTEHQNDAFDLQKEMVEYCISDVEILTRTCIKFHKMMMEAGGVSPFTEAITIPGACNKLFRRQFLAKDSISILPKNGYRNADIQSKIATQWLIYEEEQRCINIQHAARQREVQIDGIKVDGYCAETKQIFEFNGCYFHGCPTCFSNTDREKPLHEDSTDSLNARYARTVEKADRLRQKGFEIIVKWEHEFKAYLKMNRELRGKLEKHPLIAYTPLDPRDAFYGGRTGCAKSFYKARANEKIKYVDVCSLYPWVCKYGKFPIGHPIAVLVGAECTGQNLAQINGLIKCKILPPTNLYHPILPVKMNNKLMFLLCRTCGEELNQKECLHNEEEERALTGTWVIDEVNKAIEKGYKVMETYEIWSYEVTQFDRKANTGGLFTPMINKFLQIKQQASGWPCECSTEEEKEAYIKDFLDIEGIQLEYEEIVKNPGLRSLGKLCLNSFWGKFGQRQNMEQASIIRQPEELFALDNNPSTDLKHLTEINEKVLIASWSFKDDAALTLDTVNVVIASFVTTGARLKLFSYLEMLGERVLYWDTDSVIYVSRDGEPDVPTGSSLGLMTDELTEYGPGSYIEEFFSAGPKNYGYVVYSPLTGKRKHVCKVKGFNLNYEVGQKVNSEVMKQMVRGQVESVSVKQSQIRRSRTHQLVSLEETKLYRACLEKRKFTADHDSIPYGFKRIKE